MEVLYCLRCFLEGVLLLSKVCQNIFPISNIYEVVALRVRRPESRLTVCWAFLFDKKHISNKQVFEIGRLGGRT